MSKLICTTALLSLQFIALKPIINCSQEKNLGDFSPLDSASQEEKSGELGQNLGNFSFP